MSFFLEEWIRARLGASIDFSQMGNEFYDGNLFFKILQSYDVVGSEVKQYFRHAKTPQEALGNLNLLRVTFKLLGVLRNDDVLDRISKKDGEACVDLLNQLYLRLANKHVLPLVTEGQKMQVLRQETGRFKVSKVAEIQAHHSPRLRPEEKLISRLRTSIRIFYREKSDVPLVTAKESKDKLHDASKRFRCEIENKIKECKCGSTIEECLKQFDEKVEQQATKEPLRKFCPPDEYVKMLKLRSFKLAKDKEMETKLKDIIVKKLWCKQLQQREEEFRCSLADKLLKQSNYEREMVQRLGQIHLQHRILKEKRRKLHEEAQRIYKDRIETIQWRKKSKADLEHAREKQRLQDLHRKIFDEKIAAVREDRWKMVRDVVDDIVDFALKKIRFESEHLVKVSPRDLKQWKTLFFKSLPLLPKLHNLKNENMIVASESEESFDTYVDKDELAQETLNENALNEYLLLLGPWTKELWPELQNVEEEMQVLGFVVHRLLEDKYSLPQPPEPVDLPLYPVRVVLDNLNDAKAIKTLKSLLEKPKIEVIELPSLINACVAQYKREIGLDERPSKKKGKSSANVRKSIKYSKDEETKYRSVETQYPSVLEVDPHLSKIAEFGKKAFETLSTGSKLPDDLVSDILIEHLRNLSERNGWVLVNFPSDSRQVHCMESKFTGIEPPIKWSVQRENSLSEEELKKNERIMMAKEGVCEEISSQTTSTSSEADDLNKLNILRTSRLLPRPNPAKSPVIFHSYFTHFIHLEVGNNAAEDAKGSKNDSTEESNNDFLSKPCEAEDQTPKTFYDNTDVYLYFPYVKLDLVTLKQLGRAIIDENNESGPERKTSFELFGEIAKDRSIKASSRKSLRAPMSKKKTIIFTDEDLLKMDEMSDVYETEEVVDVTDILKVDSVSCQVGDLCWEYTTPEIPEECKLALASLWESIEMTYIQNFIELFSFYREHDASVVPYRNSVFQKLISIMETPDERQQLVTEFQTQLNNVHSVLRSHGDVKKEMFCRIFDLQLKLWELCDLKKTSSENERKRLINDNWLPVHLCELFNIYVTMMETEIDRFSDSIQLLHDYYHSSLSKTFYSSRTEKWYLPRYKISEFEAVGSDLPVSVTEDYGNGESELLKNTKKSFLLKRGIDLVLSTRGIDETFADILVDSEYDKDLVDPITVSMNELLSKIMNEVSNAANHQFAAIEKEKRILFSSSKMSKSRGTAAKRKPSASLFSKDKSEKSIAAELGSSVSIEEPSKQESLHKALVEWATGVQNEMDRIVFRLLLIKNRFGDDVAELKELMMETFHGLHNEIATRYFVQTRNCDNLLRLLMASVEAETEIKPTLVLTLDKFYAETIKSPSVVPPPPVTPIGESDEDFTFTIQQLYRFASKMISVSPLGVTVDTFIGVIEDMVLVGKENGDPYLPRGWLQMTRSDIRRVIRGVLGDMIMVDWKDFIIFGLEFRFPSLNEVIETRDKFLALDPHRTETVSKEGFDSVVLWFERELRDTIRGDLRVVLGKQFLFDLYKVDYNNMNYTAFLLNFCKDENPNDGFAKALGLATGFGYVLREEELHLLNLEAKNAEAEIVVKQIINILLQNTLNRAEGTVITEVDNDGNPIGNFEEEFVKKDYGFFHAESLLQKQTDNSTSAGSEGTEKRIPSTKSISQSRQKPTAEPLTKDSDDAGRTPVSSDNYVTGDESVEDDITEDSIIWKSWLPRELVLSLILTCLQAYSLPEGQFHIQTEVEEQLKALYAERGIRDCIQGHVLVQSQLIRDLFSSCYKFKTCCLTQLIKSVIQANKASYIAQLF